MKDLRLFQNFHFVTYRHWKKHHFQYERSSSFSFKCLTKGRGYVQVGDTILPMEEGDLVYIPKDTAYSAYWKGDDYAEFVSCRTTIFPEAMSETYYPPYWARALMGVKSAHTNPKYFTPQLLPRSLVPEFLEIPRDTVPNTEALARFFIWLSKAIPHMKIRENNADILLVEQARYYIDQNPGCKVPQIAAHCGVSEPTLYKNIQKATGKTPNQLRQEILIQKAVHLLTTTDKSVHDISDLLFFSSPNYFRKILRDHTGKSPLQIRKSSKPDI